MRIVYSGYRTKVELGLLYRFILSAILSFILLFYFTKENTQQEKGRCETPFFLVLQENQEKIVHSDGVLLTQITATPFFHGLVHFTALAV